MGFEPHCKYFLDPIVKRQPKVQWTETPSPLIIKKNKKSNEPSIFGPTKEVPKVQVPKFAPKIGKKSQDVYEKIGKI